MTPSAVLEHRIAPLDLRRVYVFPTRHGWLLGALLIVILLGAINYDNALAYLLCFLLGGIFLVAMLHTYRNLGGLAMVAWRADPVFAGNDARFTLQLAGSPAHRRFNLEFARIAKRGAWRRPAVYGTSATLQACGGEAEVALTVPAVRRGRNALDRLRVRSAFPLGILQAWAYFEVDVECIAYPAPHGTLPFPSGATSGTDDAGAKIGGDDFTDLAAYRPGDPLRSIHWPALAKRDEVWVKRFAGNGAGEILLAWQALPSNLDLESRLSQLARWALDAERAGLRYGLALPSESIPAGRGGAHCAALLRALALFEDR